MPTATLTSKGQLTLPKAIRDRLRLQPGDAVDFVVTEDGEIHLRAGHVDARELRGLLKRPGRKPISVAAMDAAILAAHRRQA
jgi:antitoxin PrlF